MVPLLILTHGEFGPLLLKAAQGMLGVTPAVQALGLALDESREAFAGRVELALSQLGPGTLVLVDIAGGTPWNTALAPTLKQGGDLLAGISLPVLIEALQRTPQASSADGLAQELTLGSHLVRAKALLAGGGSA